MVSTPRTQSSGNISNARAKPLLEIIPDSRFIVFHGGEHEAQPVVLRGVVRLTTPDSMTIHHPKIRLEGKRKISWWYMGGMSPSEVAEKRTFWTQEQKLGIETPHKINAGVIEWPFEFELAPSMPESVEGLRETYIAYHLRATVSRPGWNARDLTAQDHIRIVRSLGLDSIEMTRSRVNADIWANKISYSISIPSDAIVFGTSITADVELSPIKKGLRLGKVELRLLETVVKRIQQSEVPDARSDRTKSDEAEVAKQNMDFPEGSRVLYEDETVDNPVLADEMYRFKATLPLPKSLNICRQDVDSHQINITHRFKLMVNIHNPEGHISQLVCRLPVKLFISPNLPVDESNNVCRGFSNLPDEALNGEATITAPPQYGQHQLDQLFSDVDTAGYLSRAGSGPATPAGLNAQSRRGSHEALASLNQVANDEVLRSSSPHGENHGSATPSVLHSRLADLQERGGSSRRSARSPGWRPFALSSTASGTSTPLHEHIIPPEDSTNRTGTYFPILPGSRERSPSGDNRTPNSRRHSAEDGAESSLRHGNVGSVEDSYDLQNLSRVPSYGAALRTSSTATPFTDAPPSYLAATSRPPSPLLTAHSAPQRPSAAHMRLEHNNPNGSLTTNHNVSNIARGNVADGTEVPASSAVSFGDFALPTSPLVNSRTHRGSAVEDDTARLLMLRARN